MTAQDRKEMIRRLADELWNRGNLDVVEQMYAPHCSLHDPSFPIDGLEGMKQRVRDLRAAQPDLHIDVHDVVAEGDLTAQRWTMGGTARGEFRGLPATGKTYVMSGMTLSKWEGDQIVEEWVNYDLLGALQQLGIIPETAVTGQTAQPSRSASDMSGPGESSPGMSAPPTSPA